jgi:hypothetical protein
MSLAVAALLAGTIAPVSGFQDAPARPEFSKAEMDQLFTLCRLKPEEALWDDLPWASGLAAGLKKASKEGKPLFLTFAGGGGHPLGMC